MKSKRLFVTGFGLDPMPPDSSIKGKRKGVLGTLSRLNIYSLLHFPRILGDGKNVFNCFSSVFLNFIGKDEVFHGLLSLIYLAADQ